MQSLAAHLRALSPEQLTRLVANRRDVTIAPAPTSADQLAVRLLDPSSMVAAASLLTLPQLQVAEAAVELGDGCTTARLAALLGVPEDDPDLAAALGRLTELALVWPHADGVKEQLAKLELAADGWDTALEAVPQWRSKVTPESESRKMRTSERSCPER